MITMSTLNYAFSFIVLKFYDLYLVPLLQVEAENGGLTWWGALLILGFIILVVVLALARNASKTTAPEVEHSSHDMHADLKTPAAPALLADDLTRIEGIGPKIASLLGENGITTFEQLGNADLTALRTILENARLQFADPTSWPEQAKLAAKADWEELAALQASLKGGRK
jgi:predicted flap endonuclease-1-like 5' DNA nuclease